MVVLAGLVVIASRHSCIKPRHLYEFICHRLGFCSDSVPCIAMVVLFANEPKRPHYVKEPIAQPAMEMSRLHQPVRQPVSNV